MLPPQTEGTAGMIVCPCCKGENDGNLLVYDAHYPNDPPRRELCCHCGGRKVIPEQIMTGSTP